MLVRNLGTLLILSATFYACQGKSPLQSTKRQPQAPNPIVLGNQGLTLSVQDNAIDALDFTFGSQGITLQKIENKGSSTVDLSRQVFIGSKAAVSDADKTTLSSLCQNIGLSSKADEYVEVSSLPDNGALFAHWRSHFSVPQKLQLSSALAALKAPMRCLLKIQVGGESANQFAYLAFDPIPVETQKLAGTGNIAEAIDEGVMLIDQNPSIALDQGQVIVLDSSADMKPKIPALNSKDFKVQLNTTTGGACRNTIFEGKTKVGNPTTVRNYQYGLQGTKAFTLGSIASQSISGRTLATCGKIKTKVADKNFTADVACGDYRAVQDEGLEAGCQWSVEVINPNDAGNGIAYNVGMEKIPFESVDVTTITGAASAIPEAATNPVRAKSTIFQGFSAVQLVSMEQSFDFWIAVSPASFTKYFDKYVTRVSYLGRTGTDCSIQGVLAFVTSLTSTEIFWCEAAGMSAAAVQNQNTPLQVMLIGVTAFHENLHTRGREHDFDAPQYQPCAGTAESALMSFDALKTCTDDYCRAFKDYALSEYKAELDYSLEGDARRFQGQCQIWNTGLGLKPTDFRT